jgi:hypothetical protein
MFVFESENIPLLANLGRGLNHLYATYHIRDPRLESWNRLSLCYILLPLERRSCRGQETQRQVPREEADGRHRRGRVSKQSLRSQTIGRQAVVAFSPTNKCARNGNILHWILLNAIDIILEYALSRIVGLSSQILTRICNKGIHHGELFFATVMRNGDYEPSAVVHGSLTLINCEQDFL